MAALSGTGTLLAQAIRYALDSVADVTQTCLTRATPCAEWDVAALMCHVNDSLAALHEGMATGTIAPDPTEPTSYQTAYELVDTFRDRADRLLAAATTLRRQGRLITIADRCTTESVVDAIGTVEIAVHGWDVATACGRDRPIPPDLAAAILNVVPVVVADADQYP
ncbi:MAG TPA: maleylpyruvate isomerase family mycothiol-dependent enzyme [Micromonosporaceae bacterium]|nr:maleylpyruvate isomerase family mycothiol-dependent enzyme [Micromonosporaceae bacterium]